MNTQIGEVMETNLLERNDVDLGGGKNLVFLLGGNSYGIPILDVSEINGIMAITRIPKTPDYIKGIINLRGKVIPVMDLRLKLGMPEKEYDIETCIIIINLSGTQSVRQIGVIVDTVSEVFDILASQIEPPPNYGCEQEKEFLNGVGKVKDKIVMLLDIKRILYSQEVFDLLSDK